MGTFDYLQHGEDDTKPVCIKHHTQRQHVGAWDHLHALLWPQRTRKKPVLGQCQFCLADVTPVLLLLEARG